QGAEDNSVIPHHKIERLIIDSGISYTFLRPAYFMQNFTTTLRKELVENNRIFLPAGEAKFTLVDVQDVGKVAAETLLSSDKHVNIGYDLTSNG
ncbi:MAG: NmrA family NAD(P)-binding protein, partial [Spirosomaceae bacterium]|nr:NmrA family NAD(P)-binding protein [Spirosomataceae bacterium]